MLRERERSKSKINFVFVSIYPLIFILVSNILFEVLIWIKIDIIKEFL
jgi:hypothetical protein